MPKPKLLISASQWPAPPPLNKKKVVLPELPNAEGEPMEAWVWELTALEAAAYQDSLRVYANGVHQGGSPLNSDLKWLCYTVRDQHGNRQFPDVERGVNQLGQYGQSIIARLILAANEVNTIDIDEAVADAEGNSEETPTETAS